MIFLRLLAALLLLAPVAARADDRAAQIAAYFRSEAASGGFNGNVLVAEGGRVVYAQSFGYADFEGRRPNAADTEFEMASVGKVFTAIAVLQLVERGSVGLDEPLARYLPAFPYKAITIRQLLSHSSGLTEQEMSLSSYERQVGRPIEMRDLVPAVVATNRPLTLRPGEKWWYSNLGYLLLARLVEERSGQRLDAYLRDHVLGPAGMRHTYLRTADMNVADTPLFARNYDYPLRYSAERVRLTGATGYYNDRLYGNARIVSTTGDMLLLDRALRDGRLLKRQTLDASYAAQRLSDGSPVYVWKNIGGMGEADDALGWFVFRDRADGRIVWHAGGTPGCVTMFMRNVDRDQTVIVFDNTGSEGVYKKALSALRILNGRSPLPTPRSLTRIYGRTLATDGEDAAFVTLLRHRDDATNYAITANDLNNLGYQFAENGRLPQALSTFRAAIALYPASDALTESYAEMLERAGRPTDAEAMYRQALHLNPDNEDATNRLVLMHPPAR